MLGFPCALLFLAAAVATSLRDAFIATLILMSVSLTVAVLVGWLIDAAVAPEQVAQASYRRRALLEYVPWPVGGIAGCLAAYPYILWSRKRALVRGDRDVSVRALKILNFLTRDRTAGPPNGPK